MEKKQITLFALMIAAIILVFIANKPIEETEIIQGNWDISQKVTANNYDQYLVEESDFDYSDEAIQSIAQQIKDSTGSAKDAIKRAALYTVQNVHYDGSVPISYCYAETASKVLEKGSGDCVSMSRLNTAILRAMGIPTRTMGGCLSSNKRCEILFSIAGYDTQTSDVLDNKKRGWLHEYVEAWDGIEWVRVESTSGQIFDISCNTYLNYGYDSNNINRCVINDNSFIKECRGGY